MPKPSTGCGLRGALRGLSLAVVLAWGLMAPAFAVETVVVMLDQAKIVRLPEKAQTVVVGNPGIADVTVQKNGVLIVTGKSYGVTNLIALDTAGGMLAESMIRVQAPSEAVVTVQRGMERQSYSCSPTCQPSVQLGDADTFFSQAGTQAGTRNTLATGAK